MFIPAPGWLDGHPRSHIQQTATAASISTTAHHAEDPRSRRAHCLTLPGALFAAHLLASLALTMAWLYYLTTPITPTDLSATPPQPTTHTRRSPNHRTTHRRLRR